MFKFMQEANKQYDPIPITLASFDDMLTVELLRAFGSIRD